MRYLDFETFKEGINELQNNKIVVKEIKKDCYFINSHIFGLPRYDEYFKLDEEINEVFMAEHLSECLL
ncbi:hypothetical protein [Bartonella alsatica]|uniref:hypothetical protein n=1 Tax=Bartonella alsatica TaxID=52764 RepID=UPI00031F201E|nr:hypothetical protein [Bartonella alsatica]